MSARNSSCWSDFSPTRQPKPGGVVGLKSDLQLVAGCLLGLLASAAQADSDSEWQFSSRAQALLSATWRDLRDDSLLNPDNRIARIAGERHELELRPDFELKRPGLALQLKPRASVSRTPGDGEHELWLNEGKLRWKPAHSLHLQAGREIWSWGPSMFWSPSNPFYLATGKNNPQRELPGRDMVRASWMPADNVALTLANNFASGHPRDPEPQQRKLSLLKLDLNNNEASGSLIASRREGELWRFGGYGQWTASDALLLYADASYGKRTDLLLAEPDANAPGWTLAPDPAARRRTTLLLGGGYTFESGITLNLEAMHYGDGLSREQAQRATAMAQQLQPLLATPLAAYAGTTLGQAIDLRRMQERRNYLALQLMDPTRERYSWNLRYIRNLDDGSGELVPLGSYDLNDKLQLWANLSLRHGHQGSEYTQLLRRSAMLGLTWFAW